MPNLIFCQVIPELNINNLTPKWKHIFDDPNFVQDTFGLNVKTKYNVCLPYERMLINNQYIVNNYCFQGNGNTHGNFIQNIDVITGEMKWVKGLNHNNYPIGNAFYPSLFYEKENDQIVLMGFEKYNNPKNDGFHSIIGEPSLSSSIRLDANNGSVASHKSNTDISDTTLWAPNLGVFLKSNTNNYYLAKGSFLPGGFNYYLNKIGQDHKMTTNPSLYFKYKELPLINYIGDRPEYIYGKDDNNHFYGIMHQRNWLTVNPLKIELYKFYINENNSNNRDSLELKYTKDLSPYLRLPETVGFFTQFANYDGNVYISMLYRDTLDNNIVKRWLLGLDSLGNELFYIDKLKVNEFSPQGLFFIGHKKGRVYFTLNGPAGQFPYIIASVSDQGDFKLHSPIKSGDDLAKIDGLRATFTDNNEIIFSVRVNSMFYHTACYDSRDFGIDFSNNVMEFADISQNIKIYPNPSSDIVTIYHTDDKLINCKATFADPLGRVLKVANLKDLISNVDISDLQDGLLLINLMSANGQKYYTQKLVKVSN